jgi:kynureninase
MPEHIANPTENYRATREYARSCDQADELRGFRGEFLFPLDQNSDPLIYLCGNSLGLQPKQTAEFVRQELDDWARLGVEGHTEARHPWMPYHEFLTTHMAEVVGALPEEVVIMNGLTANLHLMMVSFYRPTADRYKVVIEKEAFPSDRYAVESQLRFHGFDPSTRRRALSLAGSRAAAGDRR